MLYNYLWYQKMSENNPLQKYFRQPAIYVQLPSGGKGYPPGTLDMPTNGEIPIYPMTAMDEIIMRTPDALFNGVSNIKLFKSCVPNILDPWEIPNTDLDLLLTSIRIASYGHEMEMTVRCPHCQDEMEYTMDLRQVVDSIKSPDYNRSLNVDSLEIYFKPLSYKQVNDTARKQFENNKLLELTGSETNEMTEDQRLNALGLALEEITRLSNDNLASSITAIKTPETMVEEPEYIKDFLNNASKKVYDAIRDHLISIRDNTTMKPLHIKCNNAECGKEFDTPYTLDQANFFG